MVTATSKANGCYDYKQSPEAPKRGLEGLSEEVTFKLRSEGCKDQVRSRQREWLVRGLWQKAWCVSTGSQREQKVGNRGKMGKCSKSVLGFRTSEGSPEKQSYEIDRYMDT